MPSTIEAEMGGLARRRCWRRLVYHSTMTMPDGSSLDASMEVTFVEEDGRTRLTIVQSRFPTAKLRDEFLDGWRGILGALGRVVATRVA